MAGPAPPGWGAVAAGVLRIAAVFACVLAAVGGAAAGLQALAARGQAADGPLPAGGYVDAFLPAVRDDLAQAQATFEEAKGMALRDAPGASSLLAGLAAHARTMQGAADAEAAPRPFAAAHRGLVSLYGHVAEAAQAAADCLAARDVLAPACLDAVRLQAALPAEVDKVLERLQDAADEVAALA